MPSLQRKILGKGLTRVPGVKRLPIFKLLAIGEVAMLARTHLDLLEPAERRRFMELMRKGQGRKQNLTPREQDDLTEIVAKLEPRRFALLAADKLSPVPIPGARRAARPR